MLSAQITNPMHAWALILLVSVSNAVGTILIKRSRIDVIDFSVMGLVTSPYFVAGVVLYCINLFVFAKALESLPVSAAYPVFTGAAFCFVAVLAHVFFKEVLSVWQYIGIFTAFIGVVLIARPG